MDLEKKGAEPTRIGVEKNGSGVEERGKDAEVNRRETEAKYGLTTPTTDNQTDDGGALPAKPGRKS